MPRNAQSIIDHADELAARFEASEPNPLDPGAQVAVTHLRDAVVARGQAEAAVVDAVTGAREAGASWSVIAAVLGTSRQAAQQRYGHS